MKQQLEDARRTHQFGYQYLYKAKTARSNARLKRFLFKALRKFEMANRQYMSAYMQEKDEKTAGIIRKEMDDSYKKIYIILDSVYDED